jgi:hypothetical protein
MSNGPKEIVARAHSFLAASPPFPVPISAGSAFRRLVVEAGTLNVAGGNEIATPFPNNPPDPQKMKMTSATYGFTFCLFMRLAKQPLATDRDTMVQLSTKCSEERIGPQQAIWPAARKLAVSSLSTSPHCE